jgi:hypothetical protein
MGRVITRLALLAGGLGATEIGLVWAYGPHGPDGWLLVALGLVLLVAGSAGFMTPLLGWRSGPGGGR